MIKPTQKLYTKLYNYNSYWIAVYKTLLQTALILKLKMGCMFQDTF